MQRGQALGRDRKLRAAVRFAVMVERCQQLSARFGNVNPLSWL
jgi:hypothetical protein